MSVDRDNPITLLAVDDNEHFVLALKDFLSFEGFHVETASSGEAAEEMLQTLSPALIIIDISMPGMGGIEFLNRISDDGGVPRYPVLVLTARSTLRSFFAKLPIDAFLVKPCPEATLVNEVKRILARRTRRAKAASAIPSRLMLVEDNASKAEVLRSFFLSAGFSVEVVNSANALLTAAQENQPDVILIKDSLPTMRGRVVAPLMGAMSSTRTIPIVLYDELAEGAKHMGTLPQGVSRFLPTSDGTALLAAITDALEI
jgi:CheY-like chemotaxis protein